MSNVLHLMNGKSADCIICDCTQGMAHSADVYYGTALANTLPVTMMPSRSPLLNRMNKRFPRKKALALYKVHVNTEENGGRQTSLLPQHQLFDFNMILAESLDR